MKRFEDKINTFQRGYIEVDLDAITYNIENMNHHIASDTKMIAVIKADGYGHGSIPIARELEEKSYMYGFAVATAEEALALREAGIKKSIVVLGYTFPYSYDSLAREDIQPAVFRDDMLELLSKAAKNIGKPLKVHVKVDTGMSRIGITADEQGVRFIEKLLKMDGIQVEGIFTHFAKADYADKSAAISQLNRFQQFLALVEEQFKIHIPVKHCSNSAAILELPEANMDAVRAGIAMYGLSPSEEVNKEVISLRPALSFYSHVVYLKTIHAGESVSYGATFTANNDMRVATIPLGYGDGYPRSLSNKGYVLIRGQKAPILGRVCMDQFMVDVSQIPEVQEDDLVTIIGRDGAEEISAEYLGNLSGRFNYELVCDLNKRIPRVYRKNGEIVDIFEG